MNSIIFNKTLRFSSLVLPFEFEKCANEHLLKTRLCPKPGVTGEILRDYVTANNFGLTIVPSENLGIMGGEQENGTTLRLLALDEIDFSGFDLTYCIPCNKSLESKSIDQILKSLQSHDFD